jgi:hypothetical protein
MQIENTCKERKKKGKKQRGGTESRRQWKNKVKQEKCGKIKK